jgi:hypothetical protein
VTGLQQLNGDRRADIADPDKPDFHDPGSHPGGSVVVTARRREVPRQSRPDRVAPLAMTATSLLERVETSDGGIERWLISP